MIGITHQNINILYLKNAMLLKHCKRKPGIFTPQKYLAMIRNNTFSLFRMGHRNILVPADYLGLSPRLLNQSIMKYILLTICIFCFWSSSFCQTPSGLARVRDVIFPTAGPFGWRLIQQDPLNHGSIGEDAVDMSISSNTSTSIGATGYRSFASGDRTIASGAASTASGSQTTASGDGSVAMGVGTVASGIYSTAMGLYPIASGDASTAMGQNTTASGSRSTAMGQSTHAKGFATTAIGAYNTIDANANPSSFSLTNRAFVIGNGTSSNRSDAMTVLFDGSTTIAAELTVVSDARLKTKITSLGSTLSLLKLLDGKTYALKSNLATEKIGLLAQDVHSVFPQLVRKGNDQAGTLSVNYQGLIPVLINAVNEQQDIIQKQEAVLKAQQQQINQQQKQIDHLTAMVASLIDDK
jgi:hypothetical protein